MKFLTKCLVPLLVLSSFMATASDRPTMSQAQALSLVNAPKAQAYTLLDVRSAEEYSEGHIATAKNISHTTLAENLSKLADDKNQMVVVYCRSGRRAGMAEEILRNNGFTNVWHLEGDMKGWQANKLPVTTK